MSTAAAPEPDDSPAEKGFDPDSYRMTVGEHLEELRARLVLALMGLSVSVLACLLFAEKVMVFFCAPLNKQLAAHGLPTQVYYSDLTDPFMTYLKVTLIVAASIAGPWIIYQIWLFVASGLYPNERKTVTRYIPLSVTLFISGLVFVYYVVMPLCIGFFLTFAGSLSPNLSPRPDKVDGPPIPLTIPILSGDPREFHPGELWVDRKLQALRIAVPTEDGKEVHARSIPFTPDAMMAPIITIGDYITLVLTFMVTFGIAFQLPLVMLAVVSVGIVDVTFLQTKRKIVFFGMTVASAILAPGDIVTSMLALLIPLVLLYEFGLILVKMGAKRKAKAEMSGQQ